MIKTNALLLALLALLSTNAKATAQDLESEELESGFLVEEEQERMPLITVNYVASIPGAPIGFSMIYHFSKLGLYLDAKSGLPPRGENYTSIIHPSGYSGDRSRGVHYMSIFFNAGLSYYFGSGLLFYGATGLSMRVAHNQYFDSSYILSSTGNYYIRDHSNTIYGINFSVGGMYMFDIGLTLQMGLDVAPSAGGALLGGNIGIGYTIRRLKI